MRLELGCPVYCTDGPAGELADVTVDVSRRVLTHLVVAPHRCHREARLVPVELAATAERARAVRLSCSLAELRGLPAVEEFAYVRLHERALEDPDWDVGIETVLAQPSADPASLDGAALDFDPHIGLLYDRIPKGEAEVRRASEVTSCDGKRVGHLDELVVDRDGAITHLVLERGHLFRRRDVTIPIAAVANVGMDRIDLQLTKQAVRGLASAHVARRPRAAFPSATTRGARPSTSG